MNNVLENVIATIIVTALSTLAGLILRAFGFGTSASVSMAVGFLFALVVLFLAFRRSYPPCARWLTERLLESTLNETSDAGISFKKKILERVLLENSGVELEQNNSVKEFLNQEACESYIREASRNAKKIKILTIRGEKYFLGPKSLLHQLCSSKRAKDTNIEVLVLAPSAQHITEELAESLDHDSAEEIREKMRIVFDYLRLLVGRNKNFEVKCYAEPPNFKLLMFDDVMFVSTFALGVPKNDRNVKMLQIKRDGNPLFIGLERYFDDLWEHSVFL